MDKVARNHNLGAASSGRIHPIATQSKHVPGKEKRKHASIARFVISRIALIVAVMVAAATHTTASTTTHSSRLRIRSIFSDSAPSATSTVIWHDTSRSLDSPEAATLEITASVPSVNMENVPGFMGITCINNMTALARFETVAHVARWAKEPTLLLIDAHYGCGKGIPDQFAMVLATSWTIQPDYVSVKFTLADPEASGVTGDFKFVASPLAGYETDDDGNDDETNNAGTEGDSDDVVDTSDLDGYSKGYAQSAISTASRYPRPLAKSFMIAGRKHIGPRKRKEFNKRKVIPINFRKRVRGSFKFPIVATPIKINATCLDCGVSGRTVLTLTAYGRLFPFKVGFSAEWKGTMEAHTDMMFHITTRVPINLVGRSITLLEIPLQPYNIPGVFNAGPAFRIRAAVGLGLAANINIGMYLGAKIEHFSSSISSKTGLQASGFHPKYTHNITASGTLTTSVSFLIIPELTVGVSIFGHTIANAAAVRLLIGEMNEVWRNKTEGLCYKASFITSLEGQIMFLRNSVLLFKPFVLYQKCGHFDNLI